MRTYSVFIASTGDVADERDIVERVCREITAKIQEEGRDVQLIPMRWENLHGGTHPGGGQGVISTALRPDKCEIVVGILWKRLGQPSPMLQGQTPTEFEISTSIREHRVSGRPEVLVFLREDPVWPQSQEDADQLQRVLVFRDWVRRWCLTKSYQKPSDFEGLVRAALDGTMRNLWQQDEELGHEPIGWSYVAHANAVPFRQCGVTERTADITLTITGHADPPVRRHCEVRLTTPVNITNRQTPDGFVNVFLFDASSSSLPIARLGRLVSNTEVVFDPVEIRIGDASDPQVFKIANLHVNPSVAPIPGSVVPCRVEIATSVPPPRLIRSRYNQPVVGFIRDHSVRFCVVNRNGTTDLTVISRSRGLNSERFGLPAPQGCPISFYLRFDEATLGVFRTREEELGVGDPVALPQEFLPALQPGISGTRLLARFANIPLGVRLLVTTTNIDDQASAPSTPLCALVETDPNGAGPEIDRIGPLRGPVEILTDRGVRLVELPRIGGTAQACWEWTAPSPPSALRSVSLGVVVIAKCGGATFGIGTVAGTLAPITTVPTSSRVAPLPRFIAEYTDLHAFAVVEP